MKRRNSLIWILLTIFASLIGIIAIIVFIYYSVLTINDLRNAPECQRASNFGDFMSGTVGILLLIVSTIFLFVTFRLQRSQFELSMKDSYMTRFEGTFYNLLSMLYSVRNEVCKELDMESKGQIKNFSDYYEILRNSYRVKIKDDANFENLMKHFSAKKMIPAERDVAIDELGTLYENFVLTSGCSVGFYFRFIYNLINFVVEKWQKEPQEIHKYLNFIQSQMSDEELSLLFYDGLSLYGLDKNKKRTFQSVLDKYGFLENIPSNKLLSRSHYKIYECTRFKFLNSDELKSVKH